jgi:AI-2 transport protein TqsA
MPAAGVRSSQSVDADRSDLLTSESVRLLLGAACIVIISWGIKAASGVLSLILLGFLLAYSALPFVKWIMHQFHLRKTLALALGGALLGTLQVVLVVVLYKNALSVKQKLPIYEEHARDLYQHVEVLLHAHSINITGLSATKLSASNEIVRFSHLILPQAGSLFSDGLVVILLGWILLAMIAEDTQSSNARPILTQVQNDVGHYVAAYARTGVLTALANLVLLAAFGVDFPLVWCVLYFFLNFIPSIGFVLALVPPGCLALLMLGWKKALLVVGGMVLTQLVSKYAITPLFLRKGAVKVSSIEKTISLLWWVFLLGPVGGILAIPLTLTMKRFVPGFFIIERSYAVAPQDDLGIIESQ